MANFICRIFGHSLKLNTTTGYSHGNENGRCVQYFDCERCKEKIRKSLNKPHSFSNTWTHTGYSCNHSSSPTQHRDSKQEVRTCFVCGYAERRETSVHDSYRRDWSGENCVDTRPCKNCGKRIERLLGPHEYKESHYESSPTAIFSEDAQQRCALITKCSRCGYEKRDYLEHEYGEWITEKKWKRGKNGGFCVMETRTCQNCGYKASRNNHEFEFSQKIDKETVRMGSGDDYMHVWIEVTVCKHCGLRVESQKND